jgi:hypothetical protein
MLHQTYRRLDEPAKLGPFSFLQWLQLIALGLAIYGLRMLVHFNSEVMLIGSGYVVGLPAALMYFSEGSRPSLLRLAKDAARWTIAPKHYTPGPGRGTTVALKTPQQHRRARRSRSAR